MHSLEPMAWHSVLPITWLLTERKFCSRRNLASRKAKQAQKGTFLHRNLFKSTHVNLKPNCDNTHYYTTYRLQNQSS